MKDLTPQVEINEAQAEAMARGFVTVARADGDVHSAEIAMIAEFYTSVVDGPADLGAIERADDLAGDALAQFLPSRALRDVFLKTALLLAHADGNYGDGEAKQIGAYAAALDVSDEDLAALQVQVKEYLLSQLSHLANVQAGAEVAKELDI